MIGGALAVPCNWAPSIFRPGSIWDDYPYLLPNLFSAFAVICGVCVGILFLEETHSEKKKQRDRGLELGQRLRKYLCQYVWTARAGRETLKDETQPLLQPGEQLPAYSTNQRPPTTRTISETSLPRPLILPAATTKKSLFARHFGFPSRTYTLPVIFNIVSFGILA